MFICIYFIIIILVMEIAVSLMIVTGLEKEIARFQVVSMLTSTGFTTKESELILRHPVRRQIGIFLILFGAFSLAVLISTISSILSQSFRVPELAGVAVVFGVGLLLVRNHNVNRLLTKRFEHHLKKDFDIHELPIQEVLFIEETDSFQCVSIHEGSKLIGQKLGKIVHSHEDINVLFIKRGDAPIREKRYDLELQLGDSLYLYGSKKAIARKFTDEILHTKKAALDETRVASLQS